MDRKQHEEKSLRLLRELASLSHNKQCFDCYQRGPNYVNMTIGSFVCTKCSGLLRGLNPPHRVKSISMATFTVPEIEFLKSRGNEYCKRVWTGRYTGSRGILADTGIGNDEAHMKDYLIMKYEKKLWYVAEEETKKNLSPPFSPLTVLSKSPDLFLKQGDLLKPPGKGPPAHTANHSSNANPTYVKFDPFSDTVIEDGVFHDDTCSQQQLIPKSATMPGIATSSETGPGGERQNEEKEKAVMADKYAALAELDEISHSNSLGAKIDLKNGHGPSNISSSTFPSFTGYCVPSHNFYATPYSSFIQAPCTSTFGANPFPNPGALRPQHWTYAYSGVSGMGLMNGMQHRQGEPKMNTGFPLATQYAQSILNTGMNPFTGSAMLPHSYPRHPFL